MGAELMKVLTLDEDLKRRGLLNLFGHIRAHVLSYPDRRIALEADAILVKCLKKACPLVRKNSRFGTINSRFWFSEDTKSCIGVDTVCSSSKPSIRY